MNSGLNVNIVFKYASGFLIDAEFSAPSGVVTSVSGPSGSGKSTLLSLLSGLIDPLQGHIALDESTLFSDAPAVNVQPWNRNVGLLFQQDTLFPHLSAKRNLHFGKRSVENSPWNFASIVERFGLGQLLDRMPHQLSGGQRDRLALGRTLLSQPRMLLLDEPLSSVEDQLRDSIFDFVQAGIETLQIPTLLVSHDLDLLSRSTGQTLKISDGTLTN